MERQVVSQGVTQEQGQKRHRGRDPHRPKKHSDVEWIGKELVIILQVPLMDEHSIADQPEAVSKHQCVRKQQERAYPK
jgi:hypothetical protein